MRQVFCIFGLFLTVSSFSSAQENEIKKFYTDITTQINAKLLTQKSSLELSGFVSVNYYNTKFANGETIKQFLLQIEPILSYFFIDDLSLGVNFSYQYEKIVTGTGNSPHTSKQTFIGPIGKLYFCGKNIRPFLFSEYLFLSGDAFAGGELGLGAGIMYHVAGNIGVNLHVNYGQIWSAKENIANQNRIYAGIGLSNFMF